MAQPAPPPQVSQREQRLRSGAFAITAEITPPLSCNPDDVMQKALPLRGLADAVNVTDGAGARPPMSATAAAVFLMPAGLQPVPPFTFPDLNPIALHTRPLG